jgi:thioredoxin reductase (NADPH)
MSDYLVDRIRGASNVVVHEGETIASVHGERRLEAVTLKSGKQIPLSAVFVFIGAEPGCTWLPETIVRDKLGYILTGVEALQSGRWPLKDREPCPLETTLPRILAAGDIRSGSTKRVGFAVGDGSLAVTCVHKLTAIRE